MELAIQKGTLSSILDIVLLLLTLWDKQTNLNDNRNISQMASAPLLPFLKRFSQIPSPSPEFSDKDPEENLTCTQTFLNFVELPDDDALEVDLKQGASFMMAHLDRLATPHIPPLSFNKVALLTCPTPPDGHVAAEFLLQRPARFRLGLVLVDLRRRAPELQHHLRVDGQADLLLGSHDFDVDAKRESLLHVLFVGHAVSPGVGR